MCSHIHLYIIYVMIEEIFNQKSPSSVFITYYEMILTKIFIYMYSKDVLINKYFINIIIANI